jgi:hypothetical protein
MIRAFARSFTHSFARSSIQQPQTPRCVYHALIHALYTVSAGIHIYTSSSIQALFQLIATGVNVSQPVHKPQHNRHQRRPHPRNLLPPIRRTLTLLRPRSTRTRTRRRRRTRRRTRRRATHLLRLAHTRQHHIPIDQPAAGRGARTRRRRQRAGVIV